MPFNLPRPKTLALALIGVTLLGGIATSRVARADSKAPAAARVSVEPVTDEIAARIREEGLKRSKLPETLSYLTEVIGARLTGSPGLLRANEWTKSTLEGWGIAAKLEPWGPFGRGWTLEKFSMQTVGVNPFPVIALPKAWTTGFSGTAEMVYLDAVNMDELQKYKGKLKGKIVLISPMRDVPAHFEPQGTRRTDEALAQMASASAAGGGRRPGGGFPGGASGGELTDEQRRAIQARGFVAPKLAFCKAEGAAMVLDSARGDGGTIFVQQATVPASLAPIPAPGTPAPTPAPGGGGQAGAGQPGGARRIVVYSADAEKRMIPQVAVSVEHYNRLLRQIKAGENVKLAVDLKVKFNDNKDGVVYNTVGEIRGTDKADEIVMCGGHLDSWHGGTGATDNAAGVSVCMEALRILKALNLTPRRTIRIGLWTGEEQGIFGSAAYVREHFGTAAQPKAEHGKVSAYFNLDNGTGKIRGVYAQGNSGVMPIFAEWLKPFADLGATTMTIRPTGGTDHLPFDGAGLPGFQFIQDEIEYDARTHHSNQDVFDRIQLDDMKQAATILAAFLYNAANRDEPLPRKPAPTR